MSHRTQDLPPLTGCARLVRELRYHERRGRGSPWCCRRLRRTPPRRCRCSRRSACPSRSSAALVRSYASGFIVKNQQLATDGPYRFVRHPLYSGNILLVVGFALAGSRWWGLPLAALFFWFYYPPAIEYEDRKLQRIFGAAWEHWAARTPALVPRFGAIAPAGADDRRWSLGREQRAQRRARVPAAVHRAASPGSRGGPSVERPRGRVRRRRQPPLRSSELAAAVAAAPGRDARQRLSGLGAAVLDAGRRGRREAAAAGAARRPVALAAAARARGLRAARAASRACRAAIGLIDGEALALEYIAGPSLREQERGSRIASRSSRGCSRPCGHARGRRRARRPEAQGQHDRRPPASGRISSTSASRAGGAPAPGCGTVGVRDVRQMDLNAWLKLKYGRRVDRPSPAC